MALRAAVDRRVLRTPVPTRYGQQRTATGPSKKAPSVYRPRRHRVRAVSAMEQLSCQTTAMIHFTTPSPPPLPLSHTVCFLPRLLHDDRRWTSPKSPPLARPRGRPGHPSPQKLSHPEAAANAGDLVHRRHHRACSRLLLRPLALPRPVHCLHGLPAAVQPLLVARTVTDHGPPSQPLTVSGRVLGPTTSGRRCSMAFAKSRKQHCLRRGGAEDGGSPPHVRPARNTDKRIQPFSKPAPQGQDCPRPSNPGRYRPPSWRHGTAAVIPTTPGRYLSQLPSEAQLLPPTQSAPVPTWRASEGITYVRAAQ
jgi:hypothetical protein